MSAIKSINASTLWMFNQNMTGMASNSAKEKASRQQEMNRQVDFWENQKAGLKEQSCDSVEEIQKKLDLLQSYEDEIAAVKKAYNDEQMRHALDEAKEVGEKIAKQVEKCAPKTAEERREDMVEEALGTDESKGELMESLEELTDTMKDLAENVEELTPEDMLEELESEELITDSGAEQLEEEFMLQQQNEKVLEYKHVDVRI